MDDERDDLCYCKDPDCFCSSRVRVEMSTCDECLLEIHTYCYFVEGVEAV